MKSHEAKKKVKEARARARARAEPWCPSSPSRAPPAACPTHTRGIRRCPFGMPAWHQDISASVKSRVCPGMSLCGYTHAPGSGGRFIERGDATSRRVPGSKPGRARSKSKEAAAKGAKKSSIRSKGASKRRSRKAEKSM